MYEPAKAAKKSIDLIRMAVAKAKTLEPLYPEKIKINQKCLVIGGWFAGLTASIELASFGINTYLIEKERELEGNFRRHYFSLKGGAPQANLSMLLEQVKSNDKIKIFTEAVIEEVRGSIGNFSTTVNCKR